MKKIFFIVLLFVSVKMFGQYNPSLFTTVNKSLGISQAIPTDARSMFYDFTNFLARDFRDTAEVNAQFAVTKYRAGKFPIIIHIGGTLNSNGTYTGGSSAAYWYLNGIANTDLVPMPNGTVISLVGDVTSTVNANGVLTTVLSASGVVAGTYGDATHIPVTTYDAKGRATGVTLVSIGGGSGGTVTNVSGGGSLLNITNGTTTPVINISNAALTRLWGTSGASTAPQYLSSIDSTYIPLLHSNAFYDTKYLTSIAGYVAAGTNISIGGAGTLGSPYIFSATGTLSMPLTYKRVPFGRLDNSISQTGVASFQFDSIASKLTVDTSQILTVHATQHLMPPLDTVIVPVYVGELRSNSAGKFFICTSVSGTKKWTNLSDLFFNFYNQGGTLIQTYPNATSDTMIIRGIDQTTSQANFIKVDTSLDHSLFYSIDTASSVFKTYIAKYGAAASGITALTGDVTASGTGSVAATIANNAVTNGKFRQSAGLSVVGKSGSGSGNVADITGTTNKTLLSINSGAIGWNAFDSSYYPGSNTTSFYDLRYQGIGAGTLAYFYPQNYFNIDGSHGTPDGTTDNTQSINLAITAAHNASILTGITQRVKLSAGIGWGIRTSYRDTATVYKPSGIIMQSGVILEGDGIRNTTIIELPPPAGATFNSTSFVTNSKFKNIITATNIDGVGIFDLSINGKISNQINFNINPYITPQNGSSYDSCTDGIRLVSCKNVIIERVKLDSITGYSISHINSKSKIDKVKIGWNINGMYYAGYCDYSTLTNSDIGYSSCDNIRVLSSNVTIDNCDVHDSKINPGPQANFAGIYFENDLVGAASIHGNTVSNSRIWGNSSFGIDAANFGDTNYYSYPSISVMAYNNYVHQNASGGYQIAIPNFVADGGTIEKNGSDSNHVIDAINPSHKGITLHGYASNGAVIKNINFINDTYAQYFSYGSSSVGPVPLLTYQNNTSKWGQGELQSSSYPLSNKTVRGNNSWQDSTSNQISADYMIDSLGVLNLYPAVQDAGSTPTGLMVLHGTNNATFGMEQANSGVRGTAIYNKIKGSGSGTGNQMGVTLETTGLYNASNATPSAGRQISFYDYVTNLYRGGIDRTGTFYWGTAYNNYAIAAQQIGSDLTLAPQVDIQATSNGTANFALNAALKATLNPGFTANGYSIGGFFGNLVLGTGNNIGPIAVGRGNYGSWSYSTGANTGSANIGALNYVSNSLRAAGAINDASLSQYNNAGTISVGSANYALRSNSSAIHVGVFAGLMAVEPTFQNAALLADNGSTGHDIGVFRNNGTPFFSVKSNTLIVSTIPSGASTDSVLVWDASAGTVRKRPASAFGGATPTWQQTVTAGNSISGSGDDMLDITGTGATGNAIHMNQTNSGGEISINMENNRGSYASYGSMRYGGQSAGGLSNLFGLSRADKMYIFADGANNLGMMMGTLQSQPFVIGTNNTERFRIEGGGIIHLGTSSVSGQIWTASSTDGSGGWADKSINVLYTSTADGSVGNTVTPTSIIGTGAGTLTIPANYLVAGSTIKVKSFGVFTNDAGNSIYFQTTLGGSNMGLTASNTIIGALSGQTYEIEYTISVRGTGTTAAIVTSVRLTYTSAAGIESVVLNNFSGATVNTTISNAIDFQGRFNAASSGGNNITSSYCQIKIEK